MFAYNNDLESLFNISEHSAKSGVQIAEILVDNNVVVVIYPDEEKSIKIVSAHI